MLDLAPGHKQGFVVDNPVMLAAGFAGLGEAHWAELDLRSLGALVAGPVTLQSRAGAPMPRVAELPGGLLLETGSQNRGLHASLRTFAPLWERLGIPIVVQLADTRPEALARCAEQLSAVKGVGALEWRAPRRTDPGAAGRAVKAIVAAGDLPLWVKLPLDAAIDLVTPVIEAGADGLVIGSAPAGAARMGGEAPWLFQGGLHGPASFALMLHTLAGIAALSLPGVLIACGGIHTIAQAQSALAAGATALQLDTVAWLAPEFPGVLASALKQSA